MDLTKKDQSKPEQSKNLVILVLVLLVLISGTKLYLDYLEKNQQAEEITALTTENIQLNTKLDSVEKELQLRIDDLERLGANVTELKFLQDQIIQEKKSNAQRSAREIAALNQRINDLASLLDEKDKEIRELQARNQALNSENEALKSSQKEMEKEVATVNIQKQELASKVAEAEKLSLVGIRVSGINGRGKELSTSKGFKNKQLKGVQLVAKLGRNTIAEKGSRTAYIQVIGPNKLPLYDLSKGSGTINWSGKEEFYTAKQEFWYDSNEQTLVFFYEKGSSYPVGNYEVNLYIDSYFVGSSSFSVN